MLSMGMLMARFAIGAVDPQLDRELAAAWIEPRRGEVRADVVLGTATLLEALEAHAARQREIRELRRRVEQLQERARRFRCLFRRVGNLRAPRHAVVTRPHSGTDQEGAVGTVQVVGQRVPIPDTTADHEPWPRPHLVVKAVAHRGPSRRPLHTRSRESPVSGGSPDRPSSASTSVTRGRRRRSSRCGHTGRRSRGCTPGVAERRGPGSRTPPGRGCRDQREDGGRVAPGLGDIADRTLLLDHAEVLEGRAAALRHVTMQAEHHPTRGSLPGCGTTGGSTRPTGWPSRPCRWRPTGPSSCWSNSASRRSSTQGTVGAGSRGRCWWARSSVRPASGRAAPWPVSGCTSVRVGWRPSSPARRPSCGTG